MANVKEVQRIIDNNNVGEFCISLPLSLFKSESNWLEIYSRLLQDLVPLLQGHQGEAERAQGPVRSRRVGQPKYVLSLLFSISKTMLTIDTIDDGDDLQDALLEISGQRSVPNIFFAQQHVGGNSDLQELDKRGVLKSRLEEAGAYA